MRWLLFLSRVAFVCNLLFLVAFTLSVTKWIKNEDISSAIIISGFVLSVLFNPIINVCYLVIFWTKRKKLALIPAWIMVMNILFLILQLVFLLMLNVSNY